MSDDSASSSESEPELPSNNKRRGATGSGYASKPKKKRSKFSAMSMIDDAAVLSGSDEEEDEEEDEMDGEDNNDYVRDGFVVDEVEKKKRSVDGLDDSDDHDGDDDSDGDDDDGNDNNRLKRKKKTNRVRRLRDTDRLDEDDLALIDEARGVVRPTAAAEEEYTYDESKRIKARSEAELRKELFNADPNDDDRGMNRKGKKNNEKQNNRNRGRQSDAFDEDGMDEFIDDGDDEDGGQSRRYRDEEDDIGGGREGISEAQLNEANDIFGTEFLDFMGGGGEDGEEDYDEGDGEKFRERGVGVDLGVDSAEDDDDLDDDLDDSDDDDIFGDGDEDDDNNASGLTKEQRAEALRLKKEKRRQAKLERRTLAAKKKSDRRKAKLRRTFEPVQLVENFCTERDDAIRSKDVPERYFDWNTPFHGPSDDSVVIISSAEEEEAEWIIKRIPVIQREYEDIALREENFDVISSLQLGIVHSIVQALRYIHREKLEPDFIRMYRQDYVTSKVVREHLHEVMDEDIDYDRLLNAKRKAHTLLKECVKIAALDDSMGADEESVAKLKEDLRMAKERLDESIKEEERIKTEIGNLDKEDEDGDDDDEDLFGDDDDDEEEKEKKKEEKEKKKLSLESHLKTNQSLVQVCAEQVSQTEASLKLAEDKSADAHPGQKNAIDTSKKVCNDKLWNAEEYSNVIDNLSDIREVMDVFKYLSLVKEGTDAVRTKNAMGDDNDNDKDGVGGAKNKKKKRSRRFDRDYYRTCVSQGLRAISYQFVLSPFRAGIKLEDNHTLPNGFNWDKVLAGEKATVEYEVGDPRRWSAPTMEDLDPTSFASDLVSSGELVLLATMNNNSADLDHDVPEVNDPLRGCRYVAARELAGEPRIRKHLRKLYRSIAVLSTRPTAKGLDNIDPFHEYYGLHLLRNKSIKDHFSADERDAELQKMGLTVEERKEYDEKMMRIERDSCIQYMNILKAERGGHIRQTVHLPFDPDADATSAATPWYEKGEAYFSSRDNQDYHLLLAELEKIYTPSNPDSDEWNEERTKILRFALTNFLLPQFEAEVKRDLRDAAVKFGIEEAGKNLASIAMEGPYRPSHLLGENRFLTPTGDLPIVGVCCSSDGREATYLAAVSERGELLDHLAVPAGTQIDGEKMNDKVITFLIQARPAAIVVGSLAGLPCRLVARKLGAITTQATERWNNRFIQGPEEDDDEYEVRMRDFGRMYPNHDDEDEDEQNGPWKCNVEMVDDNVAQLFGRSVRGKKEFPEHAINLKCAVAIARHAKNPLAEITYAWGVASDAGIFGAEMLYMNIHPIQQLLPKTMLLRQYERVLSRAVADVGADLNLCCKYDHLLGLLTFVPGLGPRKAASIKHTLDRFGGVIAARRDVLAKRLVGPVVYNNAVAYLRIRDIEALSNQLLHPLDDTRLHPDVYTRNNWATKIAIDALEMDNGDNSSNADREDRAISAIRDIIQDSHNEIKRLFDATRAEWENVYGPTFNVGAWDPRINVPQDRWRDKVDELDLDTFAEMIEGTGLGKWLTHLTMIKWEFRLPFEDIRKPMEPLDREKLFRLLTGENDQSLCPGKEVTGKVARISDFGAHLKLEGDVPAFIPLRNLADGHVESAEDVVQIGSIVTAIVTDVKKDHMSVDLSLKMDDFKKEPSAWDRPSSLPAVDLAFDLNAARNIESQKSKARQERIAAALSSVSGGDAQMTDANTARSRKVTRRACVHPAFRNAKNAEIEKELKDGGEGMVGEALIRPSSKVADSLAVHWLVRKNVIKVVEVTEEDKDNDASIGNTLKIKDEVYGSIDEMLARYIAPMNDRVEELISHRKFLNKSQNDIDNQLRDMKRRTPNGVFYFLCWNEKYPGYASLRFICNSTPRYHHIGITPEGFAWYQKTYPNLDVLLNSFKNNPQGPANVKSSSMHSSSSASQSSMRTSQRPGESSSSRPSRWGAKSQGQPPIPTHQPPPPPPGNPGGWGAAQPVAGGVGGWANSPPLPPAGQYGRPAPPSLPPPPQHSYPPAPPGGYRQ